MISLYTVLREQHRYISIRQGLQKSIFYSFFLFFHKKKYAPCLIRAKHSSRADIIQAKKNGSIKNQTKMFDFYRITSDNIRLCVSLCCV